MYGKDYVMNIRWIVTLAILVDGGSNAIMIPVNAHAFFWTGLTTHFEMELASFSQMQGPAYSSKAHPCKLRTCGSATSTREAV